MKNFIFSLALLSLLVGLIIFDTLYVGSASRALQQSVAALPQFGGTQVQPEADRAGKINQAVQSTFEQYEHTKSSFSLSQRYNEIERLAAEYASMRNYARNGDWGLYSACRDRILIYLKNIENNVRVSFENIF